MNLENNVAKFEGKDKWEAPWKVHIDDLILKGKRMLSLEDLYLDAKNNQISNISVYVNADWSKHTFLNNFVECNNDSAEVLITTNKGLPIETKKKILLPVYTQSQSKKLYDVMSTDVGLSLLQTICNTKDDKEEIIQVFEKLTGRDKSNIVFITPSIDYRNEVMEKTGGFAFVIYSMDRVFKINLFGANTQLYAFGRDYDPGKDAADMNSNRLYTNKHIMALKDVLEDSKISVELRERIIAGVQKYII
jgi:hypothetical protein